RRGRQPEGQQLVGRYPQSLGGSATLVRSSPAAATRRRALPTDQQQSCADQFLAASLTSTLGLAHRPAVVDEDLTRGLDLLAAPTEVLSPFKSAYARLARLVPPRLVPSTSTT